MDRKEFIVVTNIRKNNGTRIAFIVLLFFSAMAFSQPPDVKKGSKAHNEKINERKKKAQLRQEKAFKKKHYARQSKPTQERMKRNLKETDKYYNNRKTPFYKRFLKRKYKHWKNHGIPVF